jgi:predicted DNA-binding transcriptional regulator AlpA
MNPALRAHLLKKFGDDEIARREIDNYVADVELNQIIRRNEATKWFGPKSTQIDDAIAAGKIPKPFKLIDGGRASGWTGQTVIEYQIGRIIAAARAAKAA